MDRLSLFKVLADGSRYAIYQEMAAAGRAMTTNEIAERLDLHPNTVRLHLEKMREVGLLEVSPDRHGSVGRPQHRWSVVAGTPALGFEPAGYRLLAHLLAELAARAPIDAEAVAGIGRDRLRATVAPGPPLAGVGVAGPNASPARSAVPRRPDADACLRSIIEQLAELGFDPTVDPPTGDPLDGDAAGSPTDGGAVVASIAFSRCPFRELAALYPDVVCQLHLGITEGIIARASVGAPDRPVGVRSFSSLVDEDPCRVELSISR